jgi:methylenetetrahydrofolate reductase (NADPH)
MDYSLEITPAKILAGDLCRGQLLPATKVYLPSLPRASLDSLVEATRAVAAMGYVPVPHVVSRQFESLDQASKFLDAIASATNNSCDEVFVIGGQRDSDPGTSANALEPELAFPTALDFLRTGLLQQHGIKRVGVGGYPQGIVGHVFGGASVSQERLLGHLRAKADWACETGTEMYVVSQFCLDTPALLAWVRELPRHGIDLPLRISVAGWCSVPQLQRFAQLCDVPMPAPRAGAGGSTSQGLDLDGEGWHSPEAQLVRLASSEVGLSRVQAVHVFPFGGLPATLRRLPGPPSPSARL